MLPIIGWVLYYGDGSTVSGNTDSQWRNAPSDNVQVVALLHQNGYRTLICGFDNYSLPGQRATLAKRGSWLPNEADAVAIQYRAMAGAR